MYVCKCVEQYVRTYLSMYVCMMHVYTMYVCMHVFHGPVYVYVYGLVRICSSFIRNWDIVTKYTQP